jgi:2-keto-4-pentenoate hydratase/2-oxohepta-3-ene-1,7-dioic acid hydratase in catechol pathway
MNSVQLDGQTIYPSKIVCIGRNYVNHIKELGNEIPEEPVIFIKPNSSISNQVCAGTSDLIHFEGEISFMVMAGELRGVGFGLDLTKRRIQSRLKAKGLPWERAKAFDRSAVFSDFVSWGKITDDLRLALYINGTRAQQGGCDLMLNKPRDILREARDFISFEDGDIIMTGTPEGVGPVSPGDTFSGKIFEKEKLIVEKTWTAI